MSKQRVRKYLPFLFIVFILTFSQVIIAEDYPLTIVDDLGNEITLQSEPERIISLAPNMTELLYSLDLADRIVGVTSFADYPEEALSKEKIGTITDPDIEKIVALKPDLIVAAQINKKEVLTQLRNLGINVAGFAPSSIDDTLVLIKKIGKLTNKTETADRIVSNLFVKLTDIEIMVDRVLQGRDRPKVFYEIWSDPLYTAGNGTFIDDIIERAGGINIGEKAAGAWPQYSFEQLIVENPDVYISSPHSSNEPVTVESIQNRVNYDKIKSVKNGRVYIVDQNIISRPSPRILEGLKLIVKALYPELEDEINNL